MLPNSVKRISQIKEQLSQRGYEEKDKKQILKFLPEAKLLAVSFNRWSCRTYIFVLHEECFDLYSMLIDRFLASDWGSIQVDGKPAFKKESI